MTTSVLVERTELSIYNKEFCAFAATNAIIRKRLESSNTLSFENEFQVATCTRPDDRNTWKVTWKAPALSASSETKEPSIVIYRNDLPILKIGVMKSKPRPDIYQRWTWPEVKELCSRVPYIILTACDNFSCDRDKSLGYLDRKRIHIRLIKSLQQPEPLDTVIKEIEGILGRYLTRKFFFHRCRKCGFPLGRLRNDLASGDTDATRFDIRLDSHCPQCNAALFST